MGVDLLLNNPFMGALGWTILHSIWQGLFVMIALMVVLKRAGDRAPEFRYGAGMVSLSLMLILPLCTFAFFIGGGASESAAAAAPLASLTQVNNMAQAGEGQGIAGILASGIRYLSLIYLLGVLALSFRLMTGFLQAQRLIHVGTTPLSAQWQGRVQEICTRLGVSRAVQILESRLADTPMTVGWLRPVVLIPTGALMGLNPTQLEAVIAHEVAHIRRNDYLVNILQCVVETLLFYHPGVWWISAMVRDEREHCCDDAAVDLCGSPLLYAKALAELEQIRVVPMQLSLAATGGSLLGRVRRVLNKPAHGVMRSGRGWVGALAFVSTLAGVAGADASAPEGTRTLDGDTSLANLSASLGDLDPDAQTCEPAASDTALETITRPGMAPAAAPMVIAELPAAPPTPGQAVPMPQALTRQGSGIAFVPAVSPVLTAQPVVAPLAPRVAKPMKMAKPMKVAKAAKVAKPVKTPLAPEVRAQASRVLVVGEGQTTITIEDDGSYQFHLVQGEGSGEAQRFPSPMGEVGVEEAGDLFEMEIESASEEFSDFEEGAAENYEDLIEAQAKAVEAEAYKQQRILEREARKREKMRTRRMPEEAAVLNTRVLVTPELNANPFVATVTPQVNQVFVGVLSAHAMAIQEAREAVSVATHSASVLGEAHVVEELNETLEELSEAIEELDDERQEALEEMKEEREYALQELAEDLVEAREELVEDYQEGIEDLEEEMEEVQEDLTELEYEFEHEGNINALRQYQAAAAQAKRQFSHHRAQLERQAGQQKSQIQRQYDRQLTQIERQSTAEEAQIEAQYKAQLARIRKQAELLTRSARQLQTHYQTQLTSQESELMAMMQAAEQQAERESQHAQAMAEAAIAQAMAESAMSGRVAEEAMAKAMEEASKAMALALAQNTHEAHVAAVQAQAQLEALERHGFEVGVEVEVADEEGPCAHRHDDDFDHDVEVDEHSHDVVDLDCQSAREIERHHEREARAQARAAERHTQRHVQRHHGEETSVKVVVEVAEAPAIEGTVERQVRSVQKSVRRYENEVRHVIADELFQVMVREMSQLEVEFVPGSEGRRMSALRHIAEVTARDMRLAVSEHEVKVTSGQNELEKMLLKAMKKEESLHGYDDGLPEPLYGLADRLADGLARMTISVDSEF